MFFPRGEGIDLLRGFPLFLLAFRLFIEAKFLSLFDGAAVDIQREKNLEFDLRANVMLKIGASTLSREFPLYGGRNPDRHCDLRLYHIGIFLGIGWLDMPKRCRPFRVRHLPQEYAERRAVLTHKRSHALEFHLDGILLRLLPRVNVFDGVRLRGKGQAKPFDTTCNRNPGTNQER